MNKVLIVVDYQNDFVFGALGSANAQSIYNGVKAKIEQAQNEGTHVIFTLDTHDADYMMTQEGKKLPVQHCIAGSHGWMVVQNLNNLNGNAHQCITKPTFGYLGWDLGDFDQIEMIGVCTDICVVSNALILKAMYPEVEITVDASCCSGTSVEAHNAALAVMKSCQINVIGD